MQRQFQVDYWSVSPLHGHLKQANLCFSDTDLKKKKPLPLHTNSSWLFLDVPDRLDVLQHLFCTCWDTCLSGHVSLLQLACLPSIKSSDDHCSAYAWTDHIILMPCLLLLLLLLWLWLSLRASLLHGSNLERVQQIKPIIGSYCNSPLLYVLATVAVIP
jgi:hypothetical protein